jgi:hypothetical protein
VNTEVEFVITHNMGGEWTRKEAIMALLQDRLQPLKILLALHFMITD